MFEPRNLTSNMTLSMAYLKPLFWSNLKKKQNITKWFN